MPFVLNVERHKLSTDIGSSSSREITLPSHQRLQVHDEIRAAPAALAPTNRATFVYYKRLARPRPGHRRKAVCESRARDAQSSCGPFIVTGELAKSVWMYRITTLCSYFLSAADSSFFLIWFALVFARGGFWSVRRHLLPAS